MAILQAKGLRLRHTTISSISLLSVKSHVNDKLLHLPSRNLGIALRSIHSVAERGQVTLNPITGGLSGVR